MMLHSFDAVLCQMMCLIVGELQTEVSTSMPYSLRSAEPFEVSSLKGVGHYCLIQVFGPPLAKGMY